jgi:ATP-binding cassette subfamily C protein LapB
MVDRLLLFDSGRLIADGPRDKVLALLQGKPAVPSSEIPAQPHRPQTIATPKPNAVI